MKEQDFTAQWPITYLLRHVQNALRVAMEDALKDLALSPPQIAVLSTLSLFSGASNAELARHALVSPQTMVATLKSLEERGLIARRLHPEGGRSMPANLTKAGRSALHEARLAMRDVEARILEGLTPLEREHLRKGLEHCLAALKTS
jgi:DNA-binding MarR family transcriptional regulator